MPLFLIAQNFDFTLHKKGDLESNTTILVIGGIQGDEPGGFNAASLLVTHYEITKGSLWIVPNLNFQSIIERSRGIYGDMNRKFAYLSEKDPEYETVQKIKNLITLPNIDLVLNLHDGSGFYRDNYIDKWRNPERWGQCCIIDQEHISSVRFGNLGEMGRKTVEEVNSALAKTDHRFSLKDTLTSQGDEEMAKSLTYFAIRNNKPAFGIEGSKNFGTHMRVYYHLLALESFMRQTGIEFKRDFKLTPMGVKGAINDDIDIVLNNRIALLVPKAREFLNYIPLRRGSDVEVYSTNPLIKLVKDKGNFRVYYGNRRMTVLKPQYFEYDDTLKSVNMQIDGKDVSVKLGTIVNVKSDFLVKNKNGYRVNVIGYTNSKYKNESGIKISKDKILTRYSVDNAGKIFRVEFYNGQRFSGMVLVNFNG